MNNLSKTQRNIIIGLILMAVLIIGYYVYGSDTNNQQVFTDEEMEVTEEKTEENKGKIVIHITGAIQNEGIVTLDENARVADAVEAAGGFKEDADMSKINLAYILEDGMKLKIPSINDALNQEVDKELTDDELVVESIPESNSKSGTDIININKANQEELEKLPGIGPSIALKIINYRNENGKFSSIDDLKRVSGIGENKFENIKAYICVK